MDAWNFRKNKMMMHPKVAKRMLDSMYRMSNCVPLNVKVGLADLRANYQCDASCNCTNRKVLSAIKVQAPDCAN
jgi:hypothetical protein